MEDTAKISSLVLQVLTEARRKDLPYTEKKAKGAIDKVIVSLAGNQSGVFTKLAGKFKELREKTDELSKQTDALNAEVKEAAIDLFDATDEVYTRIVETVSLTILIGKQEKPKQETVTTVNYQQIIAEISALVPELTDKIEEIIKANTNVDVKTKDPKSPQLRVTIKEGMIEDLIKYAKQVFKPMLQSIRSWSRGYSKKLKALEKKIEQLQKA